MKTLTCDLCEVAAQGATFEEWMKALMPHYMQAHPDVMRGKPELTDEENRAKQQAWMVENKARFDSAPEMSE